MENFLGTHSKGNSLIFHSFTSLPEVIRRVRTHTVVKLGSFSENIVVEGRNTKLKKRSFEKIPSVFRKNENKRSEKG